MSTALTLGILDVRLLILQDGLQESLTIGAGLKQWVRSAPQVPAVVPQKDG